MGTARRGWARHLFISVSALLLLVVLGLFFVLLFDRHGDLLLKDELVSEEGKPILEVGHHSIGRLPLSLAIEAVT